MDDARLVCGFERFRDLPCNRQRFIEWERALGDSIGQRRAFHQLQHQRMHATGVFEAVDTADVRMIQRGQRFRFALEPRDPLGIGDEQLRQDLDRDFALKLRVPRAINLPHPPGAKRREDFVRAEARAGGQSHVASWF